MPKDLVGADITIGSFVTAPATSQFGVVGIITAISTARASIGSMTYRMSKPYRTLTCVDDKIPGSLKNALREKYAEDLARPVKNISPKYSIATFLKNNPAENVINEYKFVLLYSEDGIQDSVAIQINVILDELNRGLEDISFYRKWRHAGFAYFNDGVIDLNSYGTWSANKIPVKKIEHHPIIEYLDVLMSKAEILQRVDCGNSY